MLSLSFSFCLCCCTTASPEAKLTGLDEEECEEHNEGEEEGKNIQAVILVPGELMGLDPQVFGPFVSYCVLQPEHYLIQRLHWSVVVNTGQPHGIVLVPAKEIEKKQISIKVLSVSG